MQQATFRIRRLQRPGARPANYRHTREVTDEASGQLLARCDVTGDVVFTHLAIEDPADREWRMAPNRRLMPSRWTISDADGNIVAQIDQKILGKLVNPLYRTVLAVLDARGQETCRLIDPGSTADRVFGAGSGELVLIAGEVPIARLVRLPVAGEAPRGLLGRLRRLLPRSDRGLVSEGADHALPAPVALAMVMLAESFTDASGG